MKNLLVLALTVAASTGLATATPTKHKPQPAPVVEGTGISVVDSTPVTLIPLDYDASGYTGVIVPNPALRCMFGLVSKDQIGVDLPGAVYVVCIPKEKTSTKEKK